MKESKAVTAYRLADVKTRHKVDKLIQQYLSDENISLITLSNQMRELIDYPYSKKNLKIFLETLNYPKKDLKLTRSRKNVDTSTYKKKRKEYCQKAYDKFIQNGGNDLLITEHTGKVEYYNFYDKYNLSQHEVEAVYEYLNVKKSHQYTYIDLYDDLQKHNITKQDLYKMYIDELLTQHEIAVKISKIIKQKITEKHITSLMKYLNFKRSSVDVRLLQGKRSHQQLLYNLHILELAGYQLEELANRYENDLTLTKRILVKEINSKIEDLDENISFRITDRWLTRHLDPLLTKQRLGSISREELNFRNKLIELFPNKEMQTSNRQLIAPQEIDIYYPNDNVAIEFNGDYWHSDKYMLTNHDMTAEQYHNRKLQACKEHGIELLFIWESDWVDNEEEVISALKDYFKTKKVAPILTKLTMDNY